MCARTSARWHCLHRRRALPASPTVTTELEKIADGVWFLTGGAPLSVLVEFSDHVVIIEAPQDAARSEATIAVRRAMPSKPIRYVVNTHHRFDHSGGLRGYVAEGIRSSHTRRISRRSNAYFAAGPPRTGPSGSIAARGRHRGGWRQEGLTR